MSSGGSDRSPSAENRMHVCSDCGKKFLHQSSFSRHKKKHSDKKSNLVFECSICEKSFGRKDNYVKHQRKKRCKPKMKSYDCTICEKKFGRKFNLDRHIEYHEKEEKQFECNVDGCGKIYTCKDKFDEHQRKHLANKFQLPIPNCVKQKRFERKTNSVDENSEADLDLAMGDDQSWHYGFADLDCSDIASFSMVYNSSTLEMDASSSNVDFDLEKSDMELVTGECVTVIPDLMESSFTTIPVLQQFTPMTPSMRKQKSRFASKISNFVRGLDLHTPEDQVSALTLALQQLGIYDKIRFEQKPTKSGRKLTPLETRKAVWDFYHDEEFMTESTLTSRPARLNIRNKPKIQKDLEFQVPVTIVMKRNRECYEAQWLIFQNTIRELYCIFLKRHPEHVISLGTFLALRPFYVKTATTKDVEMCVCKLHLHGRWSISSLVKLCKDNDIEIDFTNYETLLEKLTESCDSDPHTYVSWDCTPDHKTMCPDILKKWADLKSYIMSYQPKKKVMFTQFVRKPHTTKSGKDTMRLEQQFTEEAVENILEFVEIRLSTLIHHRNQLKNYRNTIHTFNSLFNALSIDIDFSEKLKILLKKEPQSLHWSNVQIIVHSGILKDGNKEYHCFLSDDLIQDHSFVNIVLDEMLMGINHNHQYIIINSDNCSAQYKCAAHFSKLQKLADLYDKKIIRVYAVPGHGKGEVDHVGGLAKVAVRREVAAGRAGLVNAESIVSFLTQKFGENIDPSYTFKNIKSEELEEERSEERFLQFITVNGSSKFQVVVFTPRKMMMASPRLCICEECQIEYGSCDLFQSYELEVQQLNRTCLRSGLIGHQNIGIDVDEDHDEIQAEQVACEFLVPGSVVALAADSKSRESFYLIKITAEELRKENDVEDDFGNVVKKGMKHFEGEFLERKFDSDKRFYIPKKIKRAYFYKESVVFPSVQLLEKKNELVLSDEELLLILKYAEQASRTSLF